jgi:hypothetical protein
MSAHQSHRRGEQASMHWLLQLARPPVPFSERLAAVPGRQPSSGGWEGSSNANVNAAGWSRQVRRLRWALGTRLCSHGVGAEQVLADSGHSAQDVLQVLEQGRGVEGFEDQGQIGGGCWPAGQ